MVTRRQRAGKSTVLNIFLGSIKPTSGKAIVCGHDVAVDPVVRGRNWRTRQKILRSMSISMSSEH